MENERMSIGVINSTKVNIYSEPDANSEIVCKINNLADVLIDPNASTTDFYKIYTAIGAEGFCQKSLILIK